MRRGAALLLALAACGSVAAAAAQAAPDIAVARYECEHEARIDVAYVNGGEVSVAVLDVEGALRPLSLTPSASGARYSVPAGQSGHVWWAKGDSATLAWFDDEIGEEVMLYMGCKRAD